MGAMPALMAQCGLQQAPWEQYSAASHTLRLLVSTRMMPAFTVAPAIRTLAPGAMLLPSAFCMGRNSRALQIVLLSVSLRRSSLHAIVT